MQETAIITGIEEDKITVKVVQDEHCASCDSHMCKAEGREFVAVDNAGLDLTIGDCVRVYFSPGKTILAGFMVLIVPCILFILFYFVSGAILSTSSQMLQSLFGVIGLAAGFVLSLVLKKKRGKEDLPEIIRKIS